MDNQHLTKYKPDMIGNQYYELDTTIDPRMTATVGALNGRQGDDMRAVPIAFTDNGQPHDLTNTTIELRVLDSAGVVKVSDKIINPVDLQGGLIVFGVPAEVYESAGDVQRAYFVLKDKTFNGSSQTISTVNVSFTVLENGIDISKKQSSIYISSLDKVLSKGGSYAVTNADNHFIGSNSIDDLTVGSLHNASLSDVQASVQSQASAISTNSATISDVNASVTALSTTLSTAQSNLPVQVTSLANSAVAVFDKRLSNVEASAENASATASATMQLLPSKANQDSLNSLSTDVDDLWDEANSNSNAIYSLSTAQSQVSPQSMANLSFNLSGLSDIVTSNSANISILLRAVPDSLSDKLQSMANAIDSLKSK